MDEARRCVHEAEVEGTGVALLHNWQCQRLHHAPSCLPGGAAGLANKQRAPQLTEGYQHHIKG